MDAELRACLGEVGEDRRAIDSRAFATSTDSSAQPRARCVGIREVLGAVAAAKPACPDPVTMLAVVERRLRALDAQVARLQLLGERLGAARAYLRRRRRA